MNSQSMERSNDRHETDNKTRKQEIEASGEVSTEYYNTDVRLPSFPSHPTSQRLVKAMVAGVQRNQGNRFAQRVISSQQTSIQRDISTPLPQGVPVQRDGSASIQIARVRIRILPDRRTRDRKMTGKAETTAKISWGTPGYRFGQDGLVGRINPMPPVTMRIQTIYGPTVTAQSSSGYGRGTTQADIQAGNTSLGFHEGNHGLDFMEYLRSNPLPVFTGTVGMTSQEYNQAVQQFNQDMQDYQNQMDQYSEQNTDCVGTNADFCPSP
jgi:hypothetical protein